MVFLPFYLPGSSLLRKPSLGVTALVLWIVGQAAWLQQAYELEFLGRTTFVPGLWLASMLFFGINCWILGIIVRDVGVDAKPALDTNVSQQKKSSPLQSCLNFQQPSHIPSQHLRRRHQASSSGHHF